MTDRSSVPFVPILGIEVSDLDTARTVDTIRGWIERRESRYICAIDVFNLMLARSNAQHRSSLANASMVTPDGTPISWVGRLKGRTGMRRVCGPDLMIEVCRQSVAHGWRHYFYGGADGVAGKLASTLQARFPGLVVAGYETPPFRPLTADEHAAVIERLSAAKPDIIWVGLGCPKQEAWMRDNVGRMGSAVLIGVGAAFDFHTGRVHRAPSWMRDNGLEWLHRLASEPRRLWRRYLVFAPRFVALSMAELLVERLHKQVPKA